MFQAASDDDIEAHSDSVTFFIRKCVEDVVPTKTIRIYPNQKPWINSVTITYNIYIVIRETGQFSSKGIINDFIGNLNRLTVSRRFKEQAV